MGSMGLIYQVDIRPKPFSDFFFSSTRSFLGQKTSLENGLRERDLQLYSCERVFPFQTNNSTQMAASGARKTTWCFVWQQIEISSRKQGNIGSLMQFAVP
ncbi:hypothetical protein Gasu2_59410 [Galdieria sulphuraria]|nr:hypothetical protein Gasu2_59410 [Galdieria sulphuraria]